MTNPLPPPSTPDTGNVQNKAIFDTTGQDVAMLNIVANNPPPMKTLVLRPKVRIMIARGNIQYDVSDDIISFSVQRVENGVSSLVFRLGNKPVNETTNTKLRYNGKFERMDRVTCYLSRVEEIQVFSGYLDMVPFIQLYAGPVDFRASCTLKRLLYTYWDPGLPSSMLLLSQITTSAMSETANGEKSLDSGMGTMIRNLLTEVGNWAQDQIHIQAFPLGWYNYLRDSVDKSQSELQGQVDTFRRLLLGSDTNLNPGSETGVVGGTQAGASGAGVNYKMEVIAAVDFMGMGPDTIQQAAGQGLSTAAQAGADIQDKTAWAGTTTVGQQLTLAAMKSDAAVICFMVVAVESPGWIMYANEADPESLKFHHDAVGKDHQSIGLFQQQPWWGSTSQRMNARESACLFLQRVQAMSDWRNMPRGDVCWKIQRPREDLNYKYALHEATAEAEVLALRQSGAAAAPSIPGIPNPTPPVGVGGAAPPPTPGASNGTVTPPTTGNAQTPAAAGGARPNDLGGAIAWARTQLGKPYRLGANGPDAWDCSSFVQAAYRTIGVEIPRTTYAQLSAGTHIPSANATPGDLIICEGTEHVVMYLGGNRCIHTGDPKDGVIEKDLWFNADTAGTFLHFTPATYYGQPVGAYNPAAIASSGGVTGGSRSPAAGNVQREQIARNLYSYMFEPSRYQNWMSATMGTGEHTREKAFINDEPLMSAVQSICQASMRNFASAPDGSFSAYYPDYFGLDGKMAIIQIEDIEMKNVQINLNDDAMATHVYVGGSPTPTAPGTGAVGWLQSQGFASVENEWLYKHLTMFTPHVPGEEFISGQDILRKYGCRPMVNEMPWLTSGAAEYLAATQIFTTKWAEQYSTAISLTFMPEIFPGMRIRLEGHNLQVYVTQVTHSGDYTNGFTTEAVIMAPTTSNIERVIKQIRGEFFTDRQDQLDVDGNTSKWFWAGQ